MAPHEPGGDDPVSASTAERSAPRLDEPIDPDVDVTADPATGRRVWPHRRRRSRRRHRYVLASVAAGGALGTAARYGLETAFPTDLAHFPWTTLWINLAGCLLLGVVLYIVFERRLPSPRLRPFLAIGVLGGFTTFSTFAVEVAQRAPDHARIAVAYLAVSLVGGPLAVLAGSAAVRRIYAMPSRTSRRRSSR